MTEPRWITRARTIAIYFRIGMAGITGFALRGCAAVALIAIH